MLYEILKLLIEGRVTSIAKACYILFLCSLYFILQKIFSKNRFLKSFIFYFLLSLSIIFFIYFSLFIYLSFFKNENFIPFYKPNNSIFSILLASQIAFIVPLFLWYYISEVNNKVTLVVLVLSIITALFLLVYSNGRSGWLGVIISIIYISYTFINKGRVKKLYLGIAAFFIITFVYIMLLYKANSSGGRILIYKVSYKMFTDNPVLGIGFGEFKIQYNKYQAAYFTEHSINSKEAILADNTYYAFNDFFQFLIENGIVGFLLLIVIVLLFLNRLRNLKLSNEEKPLTTACFASLLCIIVSALFSYPLQFFPIIFQFILCLALINSLAIKKEKGHLFSRIGNRFYKASLIIITILLSIHFWFYFQYKNKSSLALELGKSGFKTAAMAKYNELINSYLMEGIDLFEYSKELYSNNQLLEARNVLNIAKRNYSSSEVYKLSASIEMELKNYKQAEADFKTAISMIPNRMQPRLNLVNFYLEQKDTSNAFYWANSIINMPVKIPSPMTIAIRKRAIQILAK